MKALENTIKIKEKPTIIIAHTIKGKGVSFIENKFEWHSKPLSEKEKNQALEELVLQN